MDVQKFELGDDNILWPEEKHFIKLQYTNSRKTSCWANFNRNFNVQNDSEKSYGVTKSQLQHIYKSVSLA